MTRAQEINSCDPIPGTPTDPKKVPRPQIFCEKIIMDKDLEVKGKCALEGVAVTSTSPPNPNNPDPGLKFQKIDARGMITEETQFLIATITDPGPLEAVILTLADGTVTPIVAGMKILVALP